MAGSLRAGRYEVIAPIASGGMATVYLGRAKGARGFERQVAIKAMHPHLAEDPEFVAMFLDEARMASSIRHPNVVPTLDVAEDEEGLFLVMEYIDGPGLQELRRAIKKSGTPMPIAIALRIELDLLEGLHAAHEQCGPTGAPMKLVHRDVSPHNVLVGLDGAARIMDFGIARAETRTAATRAGQSKGKIPYMAPEQVRSEAIDRRTDLYAAGLVLWEMLAEKPAFQGDNEAALVLRVLEGPTSVRAVRADVPEAIDLVIRQATAASPADRYASCEEFSAALRHAARQAGVTIATHAEVGALVAALGGDKRRTPVVEKESSTEMGVAQSSSPDFAMPKRASLGAKGVAVIAVVATSVAACVAWLATRTPPATPSTVSPAMQTEVVLPARAIAPAPTLTAEVAVPAISASATASAGPSALPNQATRAVVPRPRGTAFRPDRP